MAQEKVKKSEIEFATNNPNMFIAPNPVDDQNKQWKEEKESTIPEPQEEEEEENSNGEQESTIPYAEPQEAENNQE